MIKKCWKNNLKRLHAWNIELVLGNVKYLFGLSNENQRILMFLY